MPTLPTIHGSDNTWGDELVAWLLYDHNADGSNKVQSVTVSIPVVDDNTVITTGDGKRYFFITDDLAGRNLILVRAFVSTVSSSGGLTIQVRNVTDSVDMLSTRVGIDANEKGSNTGTAAVIDTTKDDVVLGDQLAIDVDAAGSGAKGLVVALTFGVP